MHSRIDYRVEPTDEALQPISFTTLDLQRGRTWPSGTLFGGVVEYIAVVRFARKNKLDLVLAGPLPGQPMNLEFQPFELLAIAIAVGIANSINSDGQSN